MREYNRHDTHGTQGMECNPPGPGEAEMLTGRMLPAVLGRRMRGSCRRTNMVTASSPNGALRTAWRLTYGDISA